MKKGNSNRSYIYGFDKVVKTKNDVQKKNTELIGYQPTKPFSRIAPKTEILIDSKTLNDIHGRNDETTYDTKIRNNINSILVKPVEKINGNHQDEITPQSPKNESVEEPESNPLNESQKSVKWAWSSGNDKKENDNQESSATDHLTSVLGNMKVEIEDVGDKYDDSDDSDDWDTDLEEDFKRVIPVSYLLRHFHESAIIMKHHGLGPKGAIPLAYALLNNTKVERLIVADNYIKEDGAQAIAEMLQENMYIRELNISDNFIGSEGANAFAKMLFSNTTLRTLIIKGNHITDQNAATFAGALKANTTLSYLDLSHNEFGELGAISLANGIAENGNLDVMDLSWNSIRGRGGVALAKSLRLNTTLVSLNLAWNGISDVGAFALAKFLRKNTTLQRLDISNNRIGEIGAIKLGKCLGVNNALTHFKISTNPVGNKGVEAILNGAKNNDLLKVLGLEEITVSRKMHDEIEELMEVRNIKIFHGGKGGYQKPIKSITPMELLDDFIKLNRWRLIDIFIRFDKDKSGDISKDELKCGLKETGLEMSSKQLDLLIDYLDTNKDNKIQYRQVEDQYLNFGFCC
ncbi:uncharacterized protein TRIADDRAFT_51747 [Trichoplax adhaerens]|uniref:EF-hand domain-containing protein n=1 Tax=Trichoplax adhaerens TaxID=10228 RepID=B3RKS5_TRIAD|nr:hypothetical protein TRIADDRAFT_51747 [Trichoplax adhaerens]EDV29430.1 hypothetical protein TRIADDRAFT_51747 [Trichoplax adhaerens]|eukprot:XP_002108632.1 hypothetical protein TRIADDRAFT_51747 [Trichoplax adhaerens]